MDEPRAPRFDAYLKDRLGLHTMAGEAWSAQQPGSTGLARIDAGSMPFAGAAGTIGVVGEPSTSNYFIVKRYREDPNDPPHGRINVDTFRVWPALLPPQLDANRIATAASTSYNANCQLYVTERAFMKQQPHGPDHWLPQLPAEVAALLSSKST
jgi:hypothetical protein